MRGFFKLHTLRNHHTNKTLNPLTLNPPLSSSHSLFSLSTLIFLSLFLLYHAHALLTLLVKALSVFDFFFCLISFDMSCSYFFSPLSLICILKVWNKRLTKERGTANDACLLLASYIHYCVCVKSGE
ncbi:hypothetical protein GGI43DRAFT_117558 [Trichoderma evansii]